MAEQLGLEIRRRRASRDSVRRMKLASGLAALVVLGAVAGCSGGGNSNPGAAPGAAPGFELPPPEQPATTPSATNAANPEANFMRRKVSRSHSDREFRASCWASLYLAADERARGACSAPDR